MTRLLSNLWFTTTVIIIACIAGWQAYVQLFDVSPLVVPAPVDVAKAFQDLVGAPGFGHHLGVTLVEILLGFAIAIVVGVGGGAVLAKTPVLERVLDPFIVASQVTPKTPLIPLFIVWFGFGLESKVIIAAIFAFFPVFRNTVLGVKAAPEGYRDVMTVLGVHPVTRFKKMELPHAMPYVLTGMEVGIVLAVMGAIVGEFLAGNAGLGYLVIEALNSFQIPRLFALILILTALGFLMHLVVTGLRRIAIPWHESQTLHTGN